MRRSAVRLVVALAVVAACARGRLAAQSPLEAAAPAAPSLLLRADSLVQADRIEDALAVLEEHLAQSPDDFGARWRAARAAVFLGYLATGTEEENAWFRRGRTHAELALAARPDDPEAIRWALGAKGNLAVQTGLAESARLGREVWELATRALALDAHNAEAHYALGKLEYEVLKLNRAQRLLSRPFRRGELAHPSWPTALAYAERAVALDPRNPLFRLGLADTLWRMGRHADATAQLEVARELPLRGPVDRDFHERAAGLLDMIARGLDPTR